MIDDSLWPTYEKLITFAISREKVIMSGRWKIPGDYFEGCTGYFHYNEAVKRARLALRITADENVFFHISSSMAWHFLEIDVTCHQAFFWDWEGGNDRSLGVTKKKAGRALQSIGKIHSHWQSALLSFCLTSMALIKYINLHNDNKTSRK